MGVARRTDQKIPGKKDVSSTLSFSKTPGPSRSPGTAFSSKSSFGALIAVALAVAIPALGVESYAWWNFAHRQYAEVTIRPTVTIHSVRTRRVRVTLPAEVITVYRNQQQPTEPKPPKQHTPKPVPASTTTATVTTTPPTGEPT